MTPAPFQTHTHPRATRQRAHTNATTMRFLALLPLLLAAAPARAQCDRFLFVTNQDTVLLSAKRDAATHQPVCYSVQDAFLAEPLDCGAHGVTRVVGFRQHSNIESVLEFEEGRVCCPTSDFKIIPEEQLAQVRVCGVRVGLACCSKKN